MTDGAVKFKTSLERRSTDVRDWFGAGVEVLRHLSAIRSLDFHRLRNPWTVKESILARIRAELFGRGRFSGVPYLMRQGSAVQFIPAQSPLWKEFTHEFAKSFAVFAF